MALDTPERLDSFTLAGFKLQAMSPERLSMGSDANHKYFFYKNGDARVQRGRTVPKPIEFEFRMKGPDALPAARFLYRLYLKQEDVDFTWLDFSFTGLLDRFSFEVVQNVVTAHAVYTPMVDHKNKDVLQSTALTSPFAVTEGSILDVVTITTGGISDLEALFNSIVGAINDLLGPVFSFLDDVGKAMDLINSGITQFRRITAIPGQLLGQIQDSLSSAIQTGQAAYAFVSQTLFNPAVPFLQGTTEFVVQAAGAIGLSQIEAMVDRLYVLTNFVDPPPVKYTVKDTDTIASIADDKGIQPFQILAANPGLTADNLTTGQVIQVPSA